MSARATDTKRRRGARLRRKNNTGSIYQRRSDGRYVAELIIEGKIHRRYAREEEVAYAHLEALLKLRDDAARGATGRQTVAEWLARWLETTAKARVRPHTWSAYRSRLRHCLDGIGDIVLEELRPTDVARFQADLLTTKAPATVAAIRICLHAAMEEAVAYELIPRNPVHVVKAPRVSAPPMRVLTPSQLVRLFAVSEGTRWHLLWRLLGELGLRVSEATGLEWRHLDGGTLRVEQIVTRGHNLPLFLGPPKTPESRRAIAIPSNIQDALPEHRRLLMKLREAAPTWDDTYDLVFPSITGHLLWASTPRDRLVSHLTKAGLPERHPHELRHSAATNLMEAGVHPKVVQTILGHSSSRITLDRYSHVQPHLLTEAAATMDRMLEAVS